MIPSLRLVVKMGQGVEAETASPLGVSPVVGPLKDRKNMMWKMMRKERQRTEI